MGGFLSKVFKIITDVPAAWPSITKAARTAASYLSALLRAATSASASAFEALKSAAAAAGRKVVELLKQMLGSRAAAAMGVLDEVAQVICKGASSFVATVQAAVAALLGSVSKLAAPVAADVKALVESIPSVDEILSCIALVESIPSVDEILGCKIPREAKIAIAVLAVAALLYLAFCCMPAGGVAGAMMTAPGSGGLMIVRALFEANPGLYFSLLRSAGPAAAAAAFL